MLEENTAVETLPVDHADNRIGEIIWNCDKGLVYKDIVAHGYAIFYAWPADQRRGYKKNYLEEALIFLGIRKPCGFLDYEGKQKAGRMIDRNENGEVWKHTHGDSKFSIDDYYVWLPNAKEAVVSFNLFDARKMLGIDLTPKK